METNYRGIKLVCDLDDNSALVRMSFMIDNMDYILAQRIESITKRFIPYCLFIVEIDCDDINIAKRIGLKIQEWYLDKVNHCYDIVFLNEWKEILSLPTKNGFIYPWKEEN